MTQPRANSFLNAVTTVLDVQTGVSDLYNQPYDQIQEQLRPLIEKVKGAPGSRTFL
jgi:Phage capsid-like protein